MSLALVTFANLGSKQNLRTTDMLPIVDTFSARKALRQVICQIDTDSGIKESVPAIPTVIRYALRLFEKTVRPFSRLTSDKFFDIGASLRLKRADVAMFHGSNSLPRTVRRARALGSVTVGISVSAHLEENIALERDELARLGFAGYESFYVWLARVGKPVGPCDYEILMSDFARASYIGHGYPSERIFIAAIDVDTERFKPVQRRENSTFRVLYLAHTTPLKGLHYLLDAWDDLALPDAELQIVGGFSGMPQALEERYRERFKRNPSIAWLPGTDEPERFYQDASALVFPSLTEGFGRVTIEAMACGIPVITTENASGIVQDGKSGFIVPIRDAKAIAEKIRYLYDHRDIAAEMGREARREVENKKPFGEAVYEIYEEIMRREGKI